MGRPHNIKKKKKNQDLTYFQFSMKNFYYNSSGNLIDVDEKNLRLCLETDFFNKKEEFKELGLKSAFCPEKGNFSLEGYWDEKITRYVQILVFPCKNDTKNNNFCKSLEEIHLFFQNKFFSIYYSDTITNVNNYENPIQGTFKTIYFPLDSHTSKNMHMEFKKVHLVSDDGIFFL